MKHFLRILSVIVFLGFVFGIALGLNAEEKALGCSKAAGKVPCKATCQANENEVCCPVCQTKVDKEKSEFRTEHKDAVYYFRCAKCQAEFVANPATYETGCHYQYVYICPTDKEKFSEPGKCAKCGAELRKGEAKVCTCDATAKGGCKHATEAAKDGCKGKAEAATKGGCKHATETQK